MERLNITKKNVLLVIGANSDIAKAYIKEYLRKYEDAFVILASRNLKELNKFVHENNFRNCSKCDYLDLEDISTHVKFVEGLENKPSVIFVSAGVLVENETASNNQETRQSNILVNYSGVVNLLTELVISHNPNLKKIIGLSSIAGLRGRKTNYYYGSAKAGLHAFLFGLRQDLKARQIIVQSVTPGFVKTKMTAHLDMPNSAVSPEVLVKKIMKTENKFEIYPNKFWWLISKFVKFAPEYLISKI